MDLLGPSLSKITHLWIIPHWQDMEKFDSTSYRREELVTAKDYWDFLILHLNLHLQMVWQFDTSTRKHSFLSFLLFLGDTCTWGSRISL
jgi:hypothetical protein